MRIPNKKIFLARNRTINDIAELTPVNLNYYTIIAGIYSAYTIICLQLELTHESIV